MISHNILNSKSTKMIADREMLDLLYNSFSIPENFKYTIVKVTKDYEYRPDLVSIAIYGTVMYADVLSKINGCCDIREMGIDKLLLIPDIEYIDMFYNIEKDAKIVNISQNEKVENTQKTNIEPRRANEQVIGDKNFRINKDSKIIVY